jgi:hypothetical protein
MPHLEVALDGPPVLVAAKEEFFLPFPLHYVLPGVAGHAGGQAHDHHHEQNHHQGDTALIFQEGRASHDMIVSVFLYEFCLCLKNGISKPGQIPNGKKEKAQSRILRPGNST